MVSDRTRFQHRREHNLLQKNTVILSTIKASQNIEDVDCVLINKVNYEVLINYINLECAYVWGIMTDDDGGSYPVELTQPVQRDLVGWAPIHKSNKILDNITDGLSRIRKSKEHLTWCLRESYSAERAENSTQIAMIANALG